MISMPVAKIILLLGGVQAMGTWTIAETARAQEQTAESKNEFPSQMTPYLGCYNLTFTPPLPEGWDIPPRLLRLESTPRRIGDVPRGGPPSLYMKGTFAVRPEPGQGAESTMFWLGSWKVQDGQILITWSTGFGGLTLALRANHGQLAGRAKWFSDEIILEHPDPECGIVAHRVQCK